MDWNLNFDLSTGGRIALAITGTLPLFGWLLIKFKPETLEIGVDFLSLFNIIKFKLRKKFREELIQLTPDAEHQFQISPLKAETQPGAAKTLPPREGALQAWENLGKVFNKALAIYGQQSPKSLEIQDAMNLLCSANIISGNQASILLRLYQLGKDIQDNPNFAPGKKSSYEYQQIIDKLTEWLNNEINRNLPIPKKPPRKTMVEESVNPSGKEEHPAVALLGIKGASKGRQFVMEKNRFNMGANSENDVVIAGDEYVSRKHARLHFESGTLLLTDLNSRNGTYLNGKRFANASLPVNFGDEIQIGNSVFRVTAAHA